MKIIDAIGKPCPIPVIEAKKALKENLTVAIRVDNIVSIQNLEKMAKGMGWDFSYQKKPEGFYEAVILKSETAIEAAKAAHTQGGTALGEVAKTAETAGAAIFIGSRAMGEGPAELGEILLRGFIYSLAELPAPPKFLVFFNSGAFLTAEDSNALHDLKRLEALGAEILTCGTCIDYYGLQLAVGQVADMHRVAELMVNTVLLQSRTQCIGCF